MNAHREPRSSDIESAARAALQRYAVWTRQRKTVPGLMSARADRFVQWQHYPSRDVVDSTGRWQAYYHAHDEQRIPSEHGHIHLFRRWPDGTLAHAVALSFDSRGVPLCWFTTNRWVTGGRWMSSTMLANQLSGVSLLGTGPLRGVLAWLGDMLRLYEAPVRRLLQERDRKLERHGTDLGEAPAQVFKDRTLAILSRHPIDWPQDVLTLIPPPRSKETP